MYLGNLSTNLAIELKAELELWKNKLSITETTNPKIALDILIYCNEFCYYFHNNSHS